MRFHRIARRIRIGGLADIGELRCIIDCHALNAKNNDIPFDVHVSRIKQGDNNEFKTVPFGKLGNKVGGFSVYGIKDEGWKPEGLTKFCVEHDYDQAAALDHEERIIAGNEYPRFHLVSALVSDIPDFLTLNHTNDPFDPYHCDLYAIDPVTLKPKKRLSESKMKRPVRLELESVTNMPWTQYHHPVLIGIGQNKFNALSKSSSNPEVITFPCDDLRKLYDLFKRLIYCEFDADEAYELVLIRDILVIIGENEPKWYQSRSISVRSL